MTEAEALKFTRLGYRGDISKLDAEGKSLLWRAGDMRARLLLNDLGTSLLEPEGAPIDRKNRRGMCTLIHAERYLADRLAYELHPWPKNMLKDETVDPVEKRCPECQRLIIEANWCSECKKAFCGLDCCLSHKHAEVVGSE